MNYFFIMFEKTCFGGVKEMSPFNAHKTCLIGKKLIKIIFGVINTFMSTYLKVLIITITDKSK